MYDKLSAVAKLWYKKVLAGKCTINDVPLRWREEVRKALEG